MNSERILKTHPNPPSDKPQQVYNCIDECYACGATCNTCADACLAEPDPKMLRQCISLNLTCADVCLATGRVTSRMTAEEPAMFRPLLEACAEICRLCAAECDKHAEHEHCVVCAAACRKCERACSELLNHTAGQLTAGA